MSSSMPATAHTNNRLLPPEQRFWQRYSPHHELPLSAISSVVFHVLGFFLIALVIGGFLFGIRDKDRPPEVQVRAIARGDGGHPDGLDAAKAGAALPQEAITQQPEQTPIPVVSPAPDLKLVTPEPKQLDLGKENLDDRTIGADPADGARALANVQGRIKQVIAAGLPVPKGTRGGGTGPPVGQLDPRVTRQLRWTMIFNTQDGMDYLRQLQGLGAILAIPQEGNQFLVIRDLRQRPAMGKVEDISQINRIYWIDNKPQSVASLSMALGLSEPPRFIAAFFPETLETELRDKERRHFKGPEDDILETRFQVTNRGGTYEAVLVEITGKTDRPRR